MSNYSIGEIGKLISRCNNDNKSIIVSTLRQIMKEDNKINIKLMNIEKINNEFFKKVDTKDQCFCTICQEDIKSKEHKVQLPNCTHIFHKKCMNKYSKTCLLNFSCPNCKKDYKSNLKETAIKISKKTKSCRSNLNL